jgi:hypothetical protein
MGFLHHSVRYAALPPSSPAFCRSVRLRRLAKEKAPSGLVPCGDAEHVCTLESAGQSLTARSRSSEHTAVPELARTRNRLRREFDTVAHVGIARSSIEPVAFRLRSRLFIKNQKRSVSIYWVRGGSKDALGTTINPNYEASIFCHCRTSIRARLQERPRSLSRGRSLRSTIVLEKRCASVVLTVPCVG